MADDLLTNNPAVPAALVESLQVGGREVTTRDGRSRWLEVRAVLGFVVGTDKHDMALLALGAAIGFSAAYRTAELSPVKANVACDLEEPRAEAVVWFSWPTE